MEFFHSTGHEVALTASQAALADAYRMEGHYDDALSAVEKGLGFADDHGEGLRRAELHRVKGMVFLEQFPKNPERAEASFLDALEVARKQKSRSMELRIAIDLARLWRAQGKAKTALDLLEPVLAWFTEGLETLHLKEARVEIAELTA
jgi:predicted ATPase